MPNINIGAFILLVLVVTATVAVFNSTLGAIRAMFKLPNCYGQILVGSVSAAFLIWLLQDQQHLAVSISTVNFLTGIGKTLMNTITFLWRLTLKQ